MIMDYLYTYHQKSVEFSDDLCRDNFRHPTYIFIISNYIEGSKN